MSPLKIFEADLENNRHADAVCSLLDEYAHEPLEGGQGLPREALDRLIDGLRAEPMTLVLLAEREDRFAGIAVCLWGFSTFAARPALNIHDLAVSQTARRGGVGTALLAEAERRAQTRNCSRITLEVRGANHAARHLYTRCGFVGADQEVPDSVTLFCVKSL
jgi:ribosomal protein S18 acetylase RimI-like enzyme